MPQAGWCRECEDWVWVDENGACRNGHGPECVGGIYDADPQELKQTPRSGAASELERGFGSGDMPEALNRFNWGALLLPPFWGIAHALWPVVSLWLAALITPVFLATLVGMAGEAALARATLAITIFSQVVGGIARLWIGANATRLLWRKESFRLAALSSAAPRFSVKTYLGRQRVWSIVGIALTILSVLGLGVIGLATGSAADEVRAQLNVTPMDAAISAVWLVAEIGLALWLAAKMREGQPPATSAGETA